MKVNVYNQKGEKAGQVELAEEIFGVKLSKDLLHQVVVSQMANRRQGTAHTKDRSEVRGGGKKPWRQKGTGRARHGSRRSPIWVGGGVTFGPRNEKDYKKIIPVKMKKKALFMALSDRVKSDNLIVLDKLAIEKPKTKDIFALLQKLPCKDAKTLLVFPKYEQNLVLSARNLDGVATMEARELNALDVLSYKWLIMSKEGIEVIEKNLQAKPLRIGNDKIKMSRGSQVRIKAKK